MTNRQPDYVLPLAFTTLAVGVLVSYRYLLPIVRQWLTPGQTPESLMIRQGGDEAAFLFILGLLFGAAVVVSSVWWRQHHALSQEKHESDARVQAITDAARDGIIIMDQEGCVSYWNPAAERILGYTQSEAMGKGLHELIAPERYLAGFREAFPLFQRTGQGAVAGQTVELDARRKDGVEINIALSLSSMWSGGHWRAVGIVRDITQNKRTERDLLEFKTAVEQSADGIALLDMDGQVLFINNAWADMHGCSVEESVGRSIDIFHTKTQLENEVNPLKSQMLATGSYEGEVGHVRKDGTVFPVWMSSTLLKDADGRPIGFIGIVRDITEKKRADDALKKNEAMLSCVLNSVPQSIFWKDRQSVYVGCNEVFARRTGLTPQDVVDKTDLDFPWSREEAKSYQADDHEVMTTGLQKVHIVEQQHQPDGSCIWADTTKLPLRAPNGEIYGLLGVYEDITEQKRLDDELRRAKDAAEAATQVKSQFLANMSHEIRTPMTAILGYADLLNEEATCCDVCPEHSQCKGRIAMNEAISAIRRNGEHLLALINDILDISKIEAKKLQIEPGRCSPIQLVNEVASLMHPLAAAKHLELKTRIVGRLPDAIVTDLLRLRQVLVNVVGNAIKFTDAGSVCLTVRSLTDSTPPKLQFEVADTGIGMSPEQMSKLFEPFTQVDSSPTRKFAGTGLGLCISRLLANALGGDIEVSSILGEGSTFVVTIAACPPSGIPPGPEAPALAVPVAVGESALAGRVLLAEDGMDNRRLISRLLHKKGVEVTAVENGQLAVEAVLAARETGEPFDVILMDMQMPVLDGYEATRRLRAMKYTGPIIALTAHAMRQDRQECIDAGCDDYLAKPIEKQSMFATLAKYLVKEPSVVGR